MERVIHEIFEEFKKIDTFRTRFKNDFFDVFKSVFAVSCHVAANEQFEKFLEIMADEAIRFTEAVIEKDRNYPDYRKEEELNALSALLKKHQNSAKQTTEQRTIQFQLNTLLLKYYPVIFDLSSFGYRSLERNVQYYSNQFSVGINNKRNKSV